MSEPSVMIRHPLTGLAAFVAVAAVLNFANCGGDEPGNPVEDTTPPTVLATDPAGNAAGVAVDKIIRVTFSEPIDPASVGLTSILLSGGFSGQFDVTGAVAAIMTSSPLAYGTVYTVTITTLVTDTAGNHLQANYSWSFTTAADPNSLPPTVVSTSPASGQRDVPVDAVVTATFSKPMDSLTITEASFAVNNGITGTPTCAGTTATLTPSTSFAYNTIYTASIGTGVADTFGVHLQARYTWTFTTEKDPYDPTVVLDAPFNGAIVGDTILVTATATPSGGSLIDSVILFVDGARSVYDNLEPYEFEFDGGAFEVGSFHSLSLRAYDNAGRVGYSDTIGVFYRWFELAVDGSEDTLQNIRRVLGRSTDSTLELRYEFSKAFEYNPYTDTALNLAVYFDTDRDASTGKAEFDGSALNGIGADYRVIIGLKGVEDTALARYDADLKPPWTPIYDTSGFLYINQPAGQKILEFGLRWSDILNPDSIRAVSINLFFYDTETFRADWVPDIGEGYTKLIRSNQYVGSFPFASPRPPAIESAAALSEKRFINPFDR